MSIFANHNVNRSIVLIQILRFFAAVLVMLNHIERSVNADAARYHTAGWQVGFDGRFGVDIFFVISGFIMGWIGWQAFGQPGAAGKFITDRITRVAPLYWICTLAFVALNLVAAHVGDAGKTDKVDFNLVKSLLFIPFLNEDGKHRPFLGQGWTLDYEMLFYAIFAVSLLMRRWWGLAFVFVAFVGLNIAAGFNGAPVMVRIWGDRIIFEFLGGVALALLYQWAQVSIRVPGASLVLLIAVGTVGIVCSDRPDMYWIRFAAALAVVGFALFAVNTKAFAGFDTVMEKLGNASYSLYLTHSFVLVLVGVAWRKLFAGHHLIEFSLVVGVSAIVLSLGVHKYVEVPMTKAIRAFVAKPRRWDLLSRFRAHQPVA